MRSALEDTDDGDGCGGNFTGTRNATLGFCSVEMSQVRGMWTI